MGRKKEKIKGVKTQSFLQKKFRAMVLLAFVLMIIPNIMVTALSAYYHDTVEARYESAYQRLKDYYEDIDISDVIDENGGASVVTSKLEVIHLGGIKTFEENELSVTQWTEFLRKTGKLDVYGYDIAYNEQKGYWLVIQMPVSFTILVSFAGNAESYENTKVMVLFFSIILIYIAVVASVIIFYARHTAKKMIRPILKLCEYVQKLESHDYEGAIIEEGTMEMITLQKGMQKLAQELKAHESQLASEERKRRQLIAEISHDLKNPLASVVGYSELLVNREDLSQEKRVEYGKLIYQNGLRANELLLSLFHYSSLEAPGYQIKLERIEICEFVRRLAAEYIPVFEESGYTYHFDIPEEGITLLGDEKLLLRVFDNLIGNAMKYNVKGTHISIGVSSGENIKLWVSDNGKGMDAIYLEKIFTPFFRLNEKVRNSKEGGSGLGLAIVKRIVEMHSGTIGLETSKGAGCKFIMDFPKVG